MSHNGGFERKKNTHTDIVLVTMAGCVPQVDSQRAIQRHESKKQQEIAHYTQGSNSHKLYAGLLNCRAKCCLALCVQKEVMKV